MSEGHNSSHNPFDQFKIKKYFELEAFGYDISFTNSSLYMCLATGIIIAFMIFATRKRSLIPGRIQFIAESIYNFIVEMVTSFVGEEGAKFFPLIFTFFTFIVMCNLLGMTPYSYTATSQIIVTFTLAIISFVILIVYAIYRHGIIGFFKMFIPGGLPLPMVPVIFAIEFFSFLIRPITLSCRLFANMMAGHVLLKVFAGFIIALGVFGVVPFLFSMAMIGFEIFVALIQAYIFTLLVCNYLSDIVKEHH